MDEYSQNRAATGNNRPATPDEQVAHPGDSGDIGLMEPSQQQLRKLSLLLAEDNPHDVEILLEVLEGYGLQAAATIVDSPDALLQGLLPVPQRSPFDVAVVDASLRGESTVGVLKAAQKVQRSLLLPVLIFSSAISPADAAAFREIGVAAQLTKPVGFEGYSEIAGLLARYSRPA